MMKDSSSPLQSIKRKINLINLRCGREEKEHFSVTCKLLWPSMYRSADLVLN